MESNDLTLFDKFNNWLRNSITIRILSIGFMILILLIPTFMVQDLINEREYRGNSVKQEVTSTWGGIQILSGPIISIPYRRNYLNEKKEVYSQIEYAHFLPETLDIKGEVIPEKRHRRIYDVVVYTSDLQFSGNFKSFDFKDWKIEDADILWDKAIVSFGIPDMRGIKDNIVLKWNNQEYPFNPGIETNDVIASGISAVVDLTALKNVELKAFNFQIVLRGSEELYFTPLGKVTQVQLRSKWGDPSFKGAFLPDNHNITDSTFVANWKVLHLNRNFPQKWTGNSYKVEESSFGLELLIPVDHYQKSNRSAKYAIMIIAFTFLVFFFVEVLNKTRIHPIQYLLVGLALIIFYTLLLSISEHLSFNPAYIVSAIATVLLITFYSKSIFGSNLLTAFTALVLTVLYAFIFVILQLEDYALLMGSIGLFIVMAIIMYLSRKIDWYNFRKPKEGK
ncbi:MAG: cell envelope integrity protein CreD [Bacteroidales bacterium]